MRELLPLDIARYVTREICCLNAPSNDLGGAKVTRRVRNTPEGAIENYGIEHPGFSARGYRKYGVGGRLLEHKTDLKGRTAFGLWLVAVRPRGGAELEWRFRDPGVQRKIERELPAAMAPFTRRETEDLVEVRLRIGVETSHRGAACLMAASAALGLITPETQGLSRSLRRASTRRLRPAGWRS